jgi:ketosteroid isomerase-like protein
MSRENVELVRRLYDAVAARDSETVLAIYHSDLVWDHTHNSGLAGLMAGQSRVYRGHDGLRRWSRDFYEALQDVQAELVDVVDLEEDQVLVVLNYRAKGRGSGLDFEFTHLAGIFTIAKDQVIRADWYRNEAEALAAAGIEQRRATADE